MKVRVSQNDKWKEAGDVYKISSFLPPYPIGAILITKEGFQVYLSELDLLALASRLPGEGT